MGIELRLFGRTGVQVSNLCLGTMLFGTRTSPGEFYEIVDRAIDAGINFLDSANVYGRGAREEVTGRALKRNGKREGIVLATKFHGGMSDDPNSTAFPTHKQFVLRSCMRFPTLTGWGWGTGVSTNKGAIHGERG